MADYKHATPEVVDLEVKEFKDWLRLQGRSTNYASYLRNLDGYTTELGYRSDGNTGGATSVIIGRARNEKGQKRSDLKDAAGLALVISELLSKLADSDSSKKSLLSVAAGLRCYAMDFLLKGKKYGHERDLMQRYDVLKLSPLVSNLYDQNKLRAILKSRMTSQDRKTQKEEGVYFSLKSINKFLSDQKNKRYNEFIDNLVEQIVFYVYDPFEDPTYKNRIKLYIDKIEKLHFDVSGQVLILANDGKVYILLTPEFPGKGFQPAKAYVMEDLHVDHKQSIAEKLKKRKHEIPLIDYISDAEKTESKIPFDDIDANQLVKELKTLHKGIKLRIMQADLNKAKSNK